MTTAARFVIGGSLIALLPIVAARFGPAAAGVLLLFPAVSVVGLIALGQAHGLAAVQASALTAVVATPTVVVFLLGVHIAIGGGARLPLALTVGIVAWLISAAVVMIARSA